MNMENKFATLIAHDLIWSLAFYSQYQQLKAKGWKVNFSSTYPLFKDFVIEEHDEVFNCVPINSDDWKDRLSELSLLYGEHDLDKKFKGHGIKLDENYKYQQFSVSKLAQYLVETMYKVENDPELALPFEKSKRVFPPEPYTEIYGLYENELMAAPMKAFLHGLGVKPNCMCITSLPLEMQYDALVNWDIKVLQINSVSSNYAAIMKAAYKGFDNMDQNPVVLIPAFGAFGPRTFNFGSQIPYEETPDLLNIMSRMGAGWKQRNEVKHSFVNFLKKNK